VLLKALWSNRKLTGYPPAETAAILVSFSSEEDIRINYDRVDADVDRLVTVEVSTGPRSRERG
jgi:hypothetical protein